MYSGLAPVEGGELYFEITGKGPAVLLIHAGVADNTMWDPQIEAFSQSHTVVRYDTRGFGKTRSEDTSFSNRQDIYDLLAHLGIEKAALVGNSRGGHIAIDFALEFPQMASALVWVNGGVGGFESAESPEADELFAKMEPLWEAKDWEALTDLDVFVWGDGVKGPEGRAPAHVRQKMHKMILDSYTRKDGDATPRTLDPPAVGRLGEIKCPALLIIGDLDTPGTLASGEYLAENLPQAEKVVFENVAHMASMEKPEEFNKVVLDFLAKHNL